MTAKTKAVVAPAAAPAKPALGSLDARIASLRDLLATATSCRCDQCFHTAVAARDRIATLELIRDEWARP